MAGTLTVLGDGTTPDSLNARAVLLAQRFASTVNDALTLASFVDGQGQPGLEVIGFTSDQATSFQQAVDYLKTMAMILNGTAAQPSDFNFLSAVAEFVGPA